MAWSAVAAPRYVPIAVVTVAASAWGLFWIPLRKFEAAGLAAGWATFAQFAAALVVLLLPAVWRVMHGRPTGIRQAGTALFLGSAFALYAYSLLLTDVARALLLFYVTPVWSTILEVTLMRHRFTKSRALALVLGFGGLLTILGGGSGIPLPRNLGDTMAIVSGMLWACGTMRVRMGKDVSVFEHVFSFFLYGGAVAFLLALLPIGAASILPSWGQLGPLLPWLLLVALGFLIPVTCALLWGSQRIDPGRLGILLQLEAVVGIASAAVLTDEPFGLVEVAGTILIIGAGVVDVLGGETWAKQF
jgi:drug/metabolite transporter (DMT)-like permease